MLISLACLFLTGIFGAYFLQKCKLPGLLGLLITGMIIGPYGWDLINVSVLHISQDLREIALIIILMRAGLTLNLCDLRKVGRPALLMSFLPASMEILGMVLFAPKLLGVTILEAAIIGAVVGAVSPAVIVPKMLSLMENQRGTAKGIPQLIMAGASLDDVFVIVLFTVFVGLAQGQGISLFSFLQIPLSIISGLAVGMLMGSLFAFLVKRISLSASLKVIIVLSLAFLLVAGEDWLQNFVPFSGLLATMCMGVAIKRKDAVLADELAIKFAELWTGAEVLLFVLVGAAVNLNYATKAGVMTLIAIGLALVFRMLGVYICLLKTELNYQERFFCMIAYIPKATVQAAIGPLPLALGLACGNIVLTMAVVAIIITAPLGAFGIDITQKRFLSCDSRAL